MPKFLHTSIFVNDMNESIDFYTKKLGLKLLDGPYHYPGNADMAFVGHSWDAYIELVYDLEDHPRYELGNRYEHLAIEADGNLEPYIADLKSKGVKIVKDVYKSQAVHAPSPSSKTQTASQSKSSSRASERICRRLVALTAHHVA